VTRLTLLLLVDAFRRDYVGRTRFIRQLASRSGLGSLREDFGFVPRAAYFGGLTPSRFGFTNMYCLDPVRSPFGVARGLPQSRRGRAVEEELGLRSWIEAEARTRVPPYAATYLSSADIPLALLPQFDLAEKRAPWDRRVGYRSIFHELDDRSIVYFCCAWPETNRLSDPSDDGIVSETLTHVRPPVRFAYVHLQQLDAIGHAHGPESAELDHALARVDALVEAMLNTLRSRFDAVDVVLFGDHGMVSVTGSTDVWAAIERTGLRIGDDLPMFLDSTMARFWPPTAAIRARVEQALESLPGRVLDDADLQRLDLRGCDPRNGTLIFLAHPGVLISPNFFQREGDSVRGMHGYDPDCPDNQGVFIVHDGQERACDLGIVSPTRIHTEISRLLSEMGSRPDPTFTQHPDPRADEIIQQHMTCIVDEVLGAVDDVEAIVLTGSFGRGEGGVVADSERRYRPVNDYDVLLVGGTVPNAQRGPLHDLGAALAAEFGTDFVHFSAWPRVDPRLPLTLANYDVIHGSRVLWGPATILDAAPRFAAASIPLFEGVQLLFNRMAGILTALGRTRGGSAAEYLDHQVMKALIAIGDWYLLRAQAYAVSYRVRRQRFAWLAPGLGIERHQRELIDAAYGEKIVPTTPGLSRCTGVDEVLAWLLGSAVQAVSAVANQRVVTPLEAASTYYRFTTCDAAAVQADNAFAALTFAGHGRIRVKQPPAGSVRQTIYAAIPLVAAGSCGDHAAFERAATDLNGCLSPACPTDLTQTNWQILNDQLADAWLTMVH